MKILALDQATKTASTLTTGSGVFLMGLDESKRCSNGKFYYVYSVVNLINNRIYIGKRTSTSIKDSYLGSGTAIKQAVKKYGKESFGRNILEYASSPDDLHELELKYINLFGAHKNPFCYNLILDSGRPLKGRKMSSKTKERLRKLNLGKSLSSETKKKIGLASRGRIDSIETRLKKSLSSKGRVISLKQREDIRSTLKKKYENPEYKRMITQKNRERCEQVYQYDFKTGDFIKSFHCAADANKTLIKGSVYSFFNKGHRMAGGFIWSKRKVVNFYESFKWDENQKKYVDV